MIDAVHVLMLLLFVGWILFFFYAIFRFRASRNPKADYVGVEMVTLGELVGCTLQDFPNVCAWIGRMKALPHWAEVHAAHEGFVASLADREFVVV